MKKLLLALLGAFVINNIVGALLAQFILAPWLNQSFGATLRAPEELGLPALLTGYFILSLLMVVGFRYVHSNLNWFQTGIVYGGVVGLMTFLSDHLIVAGWSILPPGPMLISGLIDTLAPVSAALFISYIYLHKNERPALR